MPEGQEGQTQTADNPAAETERPPQGSAPGTKDAPPAAGGKGEADPKPTKDAPGLPKGAQVEFFKLREDRRQLTEKSKTLEAENAALKEKLATLEKRPPAPERPSDKEGGREVSIFEDEQAARKRDRELILQQLREEQEAERTRERLKKDALSAGDWLRSRSHLKEDPEFAKKVADRIQTRYSAAAETDPTAAARSAYLDVCEELGVGPDLGRTEKDDVSGGRASQGLRPSGGGGGGLKTWTRQQALDYLKGYKPGDPAWQKKAAEVETARREGRIK